MIAINRDRTRIDRAGVVVAEACCRIAAIQSDSITVAQAASS